MLTSGTTGPPKRIDLTYDTLQRVMLGAKYYDRDQVVQTRLRSGVTIVNSPLVHLGGIFRILLSLNDGRAMALLGRFTVDGWYDLVRRHRPRTSTLVPTALRMVLEADLDPDELSSIKSVVCGTAPLSADDADAFFEKYRIPVLISFAATEFGGPVAGWNLADHAEHWSAKRGSVGRVHPGSELRVVDEDDGHVLGVDEVGLLEVKAGQLGDGAWVRTTDLARLDADGFLWILGRADQAIIRGGFKVRPDDVRAALEAHPAVRGAAVVGIADERLGAVPVAVVELRPAAGPTTVDDLLEHLGRRLAPYEVPTAITVVDLLPRTDSGKVDLGGVRAIVEPAEG
jgi:acyl-coenzyme A synthetase/AMP-(fatty) acid ligase